MIFGKFWCYPFVTCPHVSFLFLFGKSLPLNYNDGSVYSWAWQCISLFFLFRELRDFHLYSLFSLYIYISMSNITFILPAYILFNHPFDINRPSVVMCLKERRLSCTNFAMHNFWLIIYLDYINALVHMGMLACCTVGAIDHNISLFLFFRTSLVNLKCLHEAIL